jgi:probable HAF family extracellular repeat protein
MESLADGLAGYQQDLEPMENQPMNRGRKQFMKTRKSVLRVLAVVLTFACIATAADAAKLKFKFKTISVPKALQTIAWGINNRGDIVGEYTNQKGALHGFLLVNGKFTNIDDPSGTYGTEPINVNSKGTIVGDYLIDSGGDVRGFRYKNGKFTDVGPQACAGSIESSAFGINDNGDIVGFCTDSSNVPHGFLWDAESKKYTLLDYPGANNFTLAWGINNAGVVTLQWVDSSGNYEGALYYSKTGKYSTPINVPGAVRTKMHSINNAGDIVIGWSYPPAGKNPHGALCRNCTSTSRKWSRFSDPKGPDDTVADGINDKHEIVGYYASTGAQYYEGYEATY